MMAKTSTRRRRVARRLTAARGANFGVLRLQPQDTLVVFLRGAISREQAERAEQYFGGKFGHRRVVAVDSNASFGVLRGGGGQ